MGRRSHIERRRTGPRALPGRSIILVPLTGILLLTVGCRGTFWTGGQRELTTIAEIRKLSPNKAKQGIPVHIRGTVTLAPGAGGPLTVQDGTGGISVDTSQSSLSTSPGQAVEIAGLTGQGDLFPVILDPVIRSLGQVKMPEPEPASVRKLATGEQDFQYLEIEGAVHSITANQAGWDEMDLVSEGKHVRIVIQDLTRTDTSGLVDALVRVDAVAITSFDARQKPIRLQLWAPNIQAIVVLRPAAADPLSAPARSIGSLNQLAARDLPHRVRITGTVVLYSVGELAVRDQTGAARIGTHQRTGAVPGDRLDIAGFLPLEDGRFALEDAIYSSAASGGRAPNDAASASLPVLTTTAAVRNLSLDEAKRSWPVRVRAVVTFRDPAWIMTFVQDSTGGIYAALPPNEQFDFRAGDIVDIEGVSGPGGFAPQIEVRGLRVVGNGEMPTPAGVPFEELFSGAEDSQWAEAEGIVQSVTHDLDHTFVWLSCGVHRFQLHVFDPSGSLRRLPLPDAKVRVRGVSGALFNRRRQLIGMKMWVPGPDYVTVLQPALSDSFSAPIRPIDTLLQFDDPKTAGHRVRVQGVVTALRPGSMVFVQGDAGGLLVEMRDPAPLETGDRVDIAGFPTFGSYAPMLRSAVVRRLGRGSPPPPVAVTADDALSGAYDSRLVQMGAQLLDRVTFSAEQVLIVQAGRMVFNAHLMKDRSSAPLAQVRNGSLLQLTGICSVQMNDELTPPVPRSFSLFLRSPEDVAVIAEAPWW
ncbi:MAG: hypothetical protein ABSG25_09120, partial [Bryobacteraceae bacterium]